MNTIVHHTPGLLDTRSFTVMGMSAKPGTTTPIGQFGTGLKYSIAGLLRSGATVDIWVGREHWQFATETEDFRGSSFTRIYAWVRSWGGLRRRRVLLPFTTQLGPHWTWWMWLRELRSNTMDESGQTLVCEAVTPRVFPTSSSSARRRPRSPVARRSSRPTTRLSSSSLTPSISLPGTTVQTSSFRVLPVPGEPPSEASWRLTRAPPEESTTVACASSTPGCPRSEHGTSSRPPVSPRTARCTSSMLAVPSPAGWSPPVRTTISSARFSRRTRTTGSTVLSFLTTSARQMHSTALHGPSAPGPPASRRTSADGSQLLHPTPARSSSAEVASGSWSRIASSMSGGGQSWTGPRVWPTRIGASWHRPLSSLFAPLRRMTARVGRVTRQSRPGHRPVPWSRAICMHSSITTGTSSILEQRLSRMSVASVESRTPQTLATTHVSDQNGCRMLPDDARCLTCIFYLPQDVLIHGQQAGQCRASSPAVVVRPDGKVATRWPLVTPDQWCGDHATIEENVS